jgi:hypothetical protein
VQQRSLGGQDRRTPNAKPASQGNARPRSSNKRRSSLLCCVL